MSVAIGHNSSLSVLRHRAFRLFWLGNLVSGCGIWVQNLAVGWLLAQQSGSSMLLGLYGFVSLAPILAFALFGGTLADRFDRRRILIATQTTLMLLALLLGGLTYFGVLSWWHMMIIAALGGVAIAINSPAYQAIVPDLVPKEDLTRAIALNSVQFNVARIVGHSAAGIVVVAIGAAGCFLLNGLTYLAMLFALWRINVGSQHRRADSVPFLTRAKEGVAFVRADGSLLRLILLVGSISLLGLPYFFLLPTFARDILHANASGLGYLTAAVSVGGLLGGLLMTPITRRWDKHAVVAVATMLFWTHLLAFAMSRNYGLSLALLIGLGFSLVLAIATVNNLLQVLTPPQMRGRVMSIHGLAVNGLAPLGSLLAGAISELMSPPIAVAGMAVLGLIVGCGAVCSAVARHWPPACVSHCSGRVSGEPQGEGRAKENCTTTKLLTNLLD